MKRYTFLLLASFLLFISCREDEMMVRSIQQNVTDPDPDNPMQGVYILNEGVMGMNKATLDYFDYATGIYHHNIYAEINPTVVKELGDVGNDLKIYGNKLYAVINSSHKIEVMDAYTAKRIKTIDVNNCRYMAFHDGKAYISSYSGPVSIDPNAQKGFVAEIDTATLEITRKVIVGYQPEEIVIHNNKLYVANSGGYLAPNYDRTVSVVDMETFVETKQIDVAINLHHITLSNQGNLYVSSRGDNYDIRSALFEIDTNRDDVTTKIDLPVGDMAIRGDSLYSYSVEFNYLTGGNTVSYGILNTCTNNVVATTFITDGTERAIMIPYGLAIHPTTGEMFITDAINYVASGYVYCYTPNGKLKWKMMAGNIPAHFAFLPKR